jgi:CHAD domain-containing protein
MHGSNRYAERAIGARLSAELRAMLERHPASCPNHASAPELIGKTPRASKAPDVSVACDTSAGNTFRHIVRSGLAHLLANVQAAQCADAEGVHQLRVAVRRLRAALVLFKPTLRPGLVDRFTDELRRIGGIFGKARDWDVFVLETLAAAEKDIPQSSRFDPLREAAQPERTIAHRGLCKEVGSLAFTRLVLGITSWIEGGTHAPLGDEEVDKPVTEIAPELLDRMLCKVIERGWNLHRACREELHALRKAIKKLRYSIEFFSCLYPQKRVDAYLRPCKELQELLGLINDAAMTIGLAERLGQAGRDDLAPVIGVLREWTAKRGEKALRNVPKPWQAFRSADPFWR